MRYDNKSQTNYFSFITNSIWGLKVFKRLDSLSSLREHHEILFSSKSCFPELLLHFLFVKESWPSTAPVWHMAALHMSGFQSVKSLKHASGKILVHIFQST